MCGIVGYNGDKRASKILLSQLVKLEYRGYDSAGIATIFDKKIEVAKVSGKVQNLIDITNDGATVNGNIGIGHTRWATHGAPTDINAHPHLSKNNKITLVHNGIIENYLQLKDELVKKGYTFKSQTDTEVIANLIEFLYSGDIIDAIFKAKEKLVGSYALGILCTDYPDRVFLVKERSPLIIGVKEDCNYFASDITALLPYTNKAIYMEEGNVAVVSKGGIEVFDKERNKIVLPIETVNFNGISAEKGGYSHFMLKEMNEEPSVVATTISSRIINGKIVLEGFNLTDDEIKDINKIVITACGSAYYAGITGKIVIENLARIPVEVYLGSELRYQNPIIDNKTLCIVISQSGETADTIASLLECKKLGAKVLGIVNVMGSTIARLSDYVLYTYAGPEIAVATTKGYTTQLAILYLIATQFAFIRGKIDNNKYSELIKELLRLSDKIQIAVDNHEKYEKIAEKYYKTSSMFFMGRNTDYCVSLEGALKLKEISYLHAESYPAGELKHGTIALIEEGSPVMALCVNKPMMEKMNGNIAEVKARGARVITVSQTDTNMLDNISDDIIKIPKVIENFSAIVEIIPLQFFAFYVAKLRGCDIDKPKNLAKSVTVE